MHGEVEFEGHRRRLSGLAYRMLGSAAEAEDVVQDAYLRWRDAAPEHPAAWLTKVVTNLCLSRLASARARREIYVGPWLPEPVTSAELGPLETAERREQVSIAFLVMLERLSPAERAVFVLREAFAYGRGRDRRGRRSRQPGVDDPQSRQTVTFERARTSLGV